MNEYYLIICLFYACIQGYALIASVMVWIPVLGYSEKTIVYVLHNMLMTMMMTMMQKQEYCGILVSGCRKSQPMRRQGFWKQSAETLRVALWVKDSLIWETQQLTSKRLRDVRVDWITAPASCGATVHVMHTTCSLLSMVWDWEKLISSAEQLHRSGNHGYVRYTVLLGSFQTQTCFFVVKN